MFWYPECWFGLVTSAYSCSHSQYSEPVTHSHSQKGCSDCTIWRYPDFAFCWAWKSSWLLELSPGTFQICLRKFVFCLSFDRYHISFTVIVVHKDLCLKLWTLRLWCLDIIAEQHWYFLLYLVHLKWKLMFYSYFKRKNDKVLTFHIVYFPINFYIRIYL